MGPLLCLYCPAALEKNTRVAHVVADALGGRKKSRLTTCNQCNNALSLIESTLSDALREYTGPLGVIQGSGNLAPAALIDHPDFGRIKLSDGVVKRARTELKEANPERVEITSGEYNRAAEQLAHQLRRFQRTPRDIVTGRVKLTIREEYQIPGIINASAEIGSKDHKRVITKMALELLACHNPTLARLPELGGVRRFIRHGDDTDAPAIRVSLPGLVKGLVSDESMAYFAHRVEVWSNEQLLNARIRLLGICEFALCLCSEWKGGPISVFHAVDPLEGKILYDEAILEDGPPLDVRALERPTKEQYRERYERLVSRPAQCDRIWTG